MGWLWRVTNSRVFCVAVYLAFATWAWSDLDQRHRYIVLVVLGISAVIGLIRSLLRLLLRWREQSIHAEDGTGQSQGPALVGEILPPIAESRNDPPLLSRR